MANKTKSRPELRKAVSIRYDVHSQIKGEDVYIYLMEMGLEQPVSYQWHKHEGEAIPDKDGGKLPYLYLPKCEDNGERYSCVVTDASGFTTTTAPCQVDVENIPIGTQKIHNVRYNDFHKMCFTQMHWTLVDNALYALSKCSDIQHNEFPEKLIEMIEGTLEGLEGKKHPEMLTFYIALCTCGTLYVTDSKNGYPYIFHMDATRTDFVGPLGRMHNVW